MDSCPSCVNENSFDLSTGAFKAIAEMGDGMVPSESLWLFGVFAERPDYVLVSWYFLA